MNIFNLFRRKKKLNYRGDYDKLERFLKENNLMGYDGKAIIYQDMFTAFFHEVDQTEYPDYYQFRQELKSKEERQQVCFKEMVDANFSNDSIEKFWLNYQKAINATYRFPSASIYFISYWHKIIEKLNIEIQSGINPVDRQPFKRFYQEFDKITKEEFQKRRAH